MHFILLVAMFRIKAFLHSPSQKTGTENLRYWTRGVGKREESVPVEERGLVGEKGEHLRGKKIKGNKRRTGEKL